MKQVLVGVYGVGKTFGDIDVIKKRNYMFTLRTQTRGVRYWTIDAEKFQQHIECHKHALAFKSWQRKQEIVMINSMARNLYNSVIGLNYDGSHDSRHKPVRNLDSNSPIKIISSPKAARLRPLQKSRSIAAYIDLASNKKSRAQSNLGNRSQYNSS